MTPKSYLSSWWQSYKYRFVPWLSFNLPKRTARRVDRSTSDKVVPDAEVLRQVSAVTAALVQTLSEPVAQARYLRPQRHFLSALREIRNVFGEEQQAGGEYWRNDDEGEGDLNEGENNVDGSLRDEDSKGDVYWRCLVPPLPSPAAHRRALQVLDRVLGYRLQRCRSHVGGTGVRVYIAGNEPRRSLPPGRVVSLYPGTLYLPQQQPVLLQSLNNPFILRCLDGLLVDGYDRSLSRILFRSCVGRDRVGPCPTADVSWLTAYPVNPLSVGQYVNNQSKAHSSNVAYQEVTLLPSDVPLEGRSYLPNIWYKSSSLDAPLRLVALVTTRDVRDDEELFADYFTLVS